MQYGGIGWCGLHLFQGFDVPLERGQLSLERFVYLTICCRQLCLEGCYDLVLIGFAANDDVGGFQTNVLQEPFSSVLVADDLDSLWEDLIAVFRVWLFLKLRTVFACQVPGRLLPIQGPG